MAISYDEYTKKYKDQIAENRRKRRKETEVLYKQPEKKNTRNNEERTWFQKGAFEDGYDFGDVSKTVLGTTADVGLGVVKGIFNIGEGIGDVISYGNAEFLDFIGQDAFADELRKETSKSLAEEIFNPAEDFWAKNSIIGERGDSISEGLGYVAGTIATGGVGKMFGLGTKGITALTSGQTFLSSMGSGMGEAYQGGASDKEAWTYGTISGASEAVTELLFGGLGKTVNATGLSTGISSLDDQLAKKVSGLFKSTINKNLAEYGIKAGAEGFEEVLSGIIQAVGQKVTYANEEDLTKLLNDQNLLEQFIVGSVVSGIVQTPGVIQSNKTGRDFITGNTVHEQTVADAVIEQRIKEQQESKGKKLTTREIGKIKQQVQEDLQKGFIDTDTIENTLGKDTDLKDDYYLQNSYNEKAKKGKEFTYEIADTDSDYKRATLESTKGVLNDTTRSHELVDAVVKLSEDRKMAYKFTNTAQLQEKGLVPKGKTANGLYVVENNGQREILVNVDSKKYLEQILVHETAHDFKTTDIKLYNKLSKATVEYAKAKGDYDTILQEVNDMYEDLDNVNVEEELTSRLLEDYVGNKEFISNLSTKEPNIVQKLIDEIKYLYKKFTATSPEARKLLELQHTMENAYKKAYRSNEVKTKAESKPESKQYAKYEEVSVFPEIRKKYAKYVPIEKLNIVERNGGGNRELTGDYKDYIDLHLDDPIEITINDDGTYTLYDGNHRWKRHEELESDEIKVAFIKDGHYTDVPSEFLGKQTKYELDKKPKSLNEQLEANLDRTIQESLKDREGMINQFEEYLEENNITNPTDEDIRNSLDSYDVFDASDGKTAGVEKKYFDTIKEHLNEKKAEQSATDSKGKTLSKEQQDFFKDSKVRDENGNLLVVYHGTRGDFNIFDIGKSGQNYEGNWSLSGKGFYFTEDIAEAQDYAESSVNDGDINTKEVYLNITKPFYTNEDYSTELASLQQEYDLDEADLYRGNWIINALKSENINPTEVLRKYGFDGIIDEGHYVVYDSNQIKNTDNVNPTESPDIRYSLSKPSFEQTQRAIALEKQNKTPDEIYLETGVYTGADGKLRAEIDDSNAKIIFDKPYTPGDTPYKLSDILEHDLLYEAYPEFRDIKVTFGDLGNYNGAVLEDGSIALDTSLYNPNEYTKKRLQKYLSDLDTDVASLLWSQEEIDKMRANYNEKIKNYDATSYQEKLKSTLMHEIQHKIQNEEGFAKGNNVEDATGIHDRYIEKIRELNTRLSELYEKSGINGDWVEKNIPRVQSGEITIDEFFEEQKQARLNSEYGEQIKSLQEKKDDYVRRYGIYEQSGYELYRNTAGEIEAREVQKRLNYTPEQRRAEMPFTKDEKTVFVERSLNRKFGIVQYSLSEDNQGRKLTNEQIKFFENSKVRDNEGKLLEVYHGTNYNFNTFDRGNGEHGKGFYFTDDYNYAEQYTDARDYNNNEGRIISSYINMTNPLSKDVDVNSESMNKLINGIEQRWELSREEILNNFKNNNEDWSVDLSSKIAEKMGYGINDVSNTLGWKLEDPYDIGINDYNAYLGAYAWDNGLNDLVRESGFDGIIAPVYNAPTEGYEYIAFNPNQIKEVTNQNPTDNPNIRYSLSVDNKGRELSVQQQEYFKDVSPELKDENGNLKTLYHGSNSKFTIFDLNKGGASNSKAGVGFWFTETESGANNFAEGVWYGDRTPTTYEVYLNLKNPKIYEPVDTTTQKQELNKQLKELYNKRKLLTDEYAWETPGITQMAYYLDLYSENEIINSLMKDYGYKEEKVKNYIEEAKKYKQLNEEYKKVEKEHDNLGYDDSYEQFRTDIYKIAGMSAYDANVGGIGVHIDNNNEVVKQYRDNLIAEGYDGIVIKNTKFDTSSFGRGNNQYVAFYPEQIKNVTNENPTDNPDIRYSLSEKTQRAIDTMGTTTNMKVAGYLTVDGQFIDFSGKYQGARGDQRQMDHRDIADIYTDEEYDKAENKYSNMGTATAIMQDFIDEGNIRTTGTGVDISVEPTKFQYDKLYDYLSFVQKDNGEVYIDLESETNNRENLEYDGKISVSKMINDIKNHYSKYSLSNEDDIAPVSNAYQTSGQDVKLQVEEAIAPLQEQIETLNRVITDLQENIAPINVEQAEQLLTESERVLTEDDAPLTEGTFSFYEDVELKNKQTIINELREDFNIKTPEARELYNKIADMGDTTVEEVYNELQRYRDVKLLEEDAYVKEIKDVIRKTRINVSDIKNQITDYNYFRKSNFGNLKLSNSGLPVDVFYEELVEMYPGYFDSNITTSADQLYEIANFMNQDTKTEMTIRLDDDVLMDLARKITSDIGNRERFEHGKSQAYHSFNYAMKNIPPDASNMEFFADIVQEKKQLTPREAFNEAVREDAKEIEKQLGYIPQDPTKGSTYTDTIERDPLQEYIDSVIKKNNIVKDTEPKIKKSDAKNFIDTGRTLFVDKYNEISNLAKDTGNKKLVFKADRLNSVAGEVENDINVAQTDNNGNRIGKSIKDLFQPSRDAGLYEGFNDYLFNKSNIERHRQGKGSKVPANVSEQLIADYESTYPEFKLWAKDVYKYYDNVLKNEVEAGLVSSKTATYLRGETMYPSYVPFFENVDNERYFDNGGELKAPRVIKKAEGGAKNLLKIEEAMIKQTYAYKSAIVTNNLYSEIVNTLEKKGLRKDIGADARLNPTQLNESLYIDENGERYLTAYINGETKSVKISEDLYNTLENKLGKQIKNLEERFTLLTKPLQKASEIRRNLLTTWSPSFLITNPIKDIQDAIFYSRYTKDMLKNYPGAFIELAQQNNPTVQQFLSLYGSSNSFGEYDIDSVNQPSKLANSKLLSKLTRANEIIELAPRYAEFKASLQNGTSVEEAIYNAKDITTNFSRGGEITKAMNRNGFTFLNASVQGFDKLYRSFIGEYGAKGYVNLLSKAILFSVAPAILNHLLLDDDEDYEALPDYIKDNYYLFKTGDGEFIRIPKGRAISVLGSAGRRTMELLEGETDAFEGYLKNAYSQVGVSNPAESNIFSPLIQAYGSEEGTTWYGEDLVPTRLQSKPAEEQYDEGTDEVSKFLGDLFNVSPYKLNYILDQYSGGMGDLVLPLITEEASSDGSFLAPIKDKFTANSTSDNKYVGEIYTLSEELTKKSNGFEASDEDVLRSKYIYSVTSEMNKLYAERREVQSDTTLSKAEKYEKTQAIKDQINALAKEGLDNYNNLTKADNYAIVGDKEFYKYTDDEGNEKWTSPKEEELEELNAMGMLINEKNSYFSVKNTISDIKDGYSNALDDASEDEKDSLYAQQKIDVINQIKNANLNDEQKYYLYDKYYSSPEKLEVLKKIHVSADDYLDYASQTFTADKDAFGKTINGSKKAKVFNYINSMNIDFEQKVILAKLEYNTYDEYNYDIIEYLNNDDTITYADMEAILKQLGFEVDSDGNIRW